MFHLLFKYWGTRLLSNPHAFFIHLASPPDSVLSLTPKGNLGLC